MITFKYERDFITREWYWTLVSDSGGLPIAESARGFATEIECLRSIRQMKACMTAKVERIA